MRSQAARRQQPALLQWSPYPIPAIKKTGEAPGANWKKFLPPCRPRRPLCQSGSERSRLKPQLSTACVQLECIFAPAPSHIRCCNGMAGDSKDAAAAGSSFSLSFKAPKSKQANPSGKAEPPKPVAGFSESEAVLAKASKGQLIIPLPGQDQAASRGPRAYRSDRCTCQAENTSHEKLQDTEPGCTLK